MSKTILLPSKNRRKTKPQAAIIDPMVEELAAMLQNSTITDEQMANKIAKARGHGMSASTIRNIRELSVTRPQNYTVEWIGFALGKRLMWTDI